VRLVRDDRRPRACAAWRARSTRRPHHQRARTPPRLRATARQQEGRGPREGHAHARARVDQGVRPVLGPFGYGRGDRLSHGRRGEPAAAAGHQHPERKHPTRGGAGDGRHADDRHRPGGDRHEARARAGGERERPEYRQAVSGVGASADEPERRLREVESFPHLRQEQAVGETGEAVRDRDHRQPRGYEPGYAAASLHAGKHNRPYFAEPPTPEVRRTLLLRGWVNKGVQGA
jgi:hypothetical protein